MLIDNTKFAREIVRCAQQDTKKLNGHWSNYLESSTMTADPMNREIIDVALSDAARVYALTEDLDRDALLRLTELFGENLLYSAFRIVQKGFVKRLVAKDSRRTVTQGPNQHATYFHQTLPIFFISRGHV